jgi:hypothetical protein
MQKDIRCKRIPTNKSVDSLKGALSDMATSIMHPPNYQLQCLLNGGKRDGVGLAQLLPDVTDFAPNESVRIMTMFQKFLQ